ncbi:RNA recognition motif domain [Dillenia turbinata]|uniref:RNA recognition motif domain n=1 Tax=Dillenia turbinata TaxID=194707 RepID=A0AAN8WBW0_9MAGN
MANNPPQTPSKTLVVSGLKKRTTSEKVHEAFSKFDEVVQARVIADRVSGYSKGFGFVKYTTGEEAKRGMEGMDAQIRWLYIMLLSHLMKIVPQAYMPAHAFMEWKEFTWKLHILDGLLKLIVGVQFDGWVIFVEYARPRLPPGQSVAPENVSKYWQLGNFSDQIHAEKLPLVNELFVLTSESRGRGRCLCNQWKLKKCLASKILVASCDYCYILCTAYMCHDS